MLRYIVLLAVLFSVAHAKLGYGDLIPNGYNIPCPAGSICDGVTNNTCISLGHNITDGGVVKQLCSTNNTYVEGTTGLNPLGVGFLSTLIWSKSWCILDYDGDGLTNGQELGDYLCLWAFLKQIPVPSDQTLLSHPGDITATVPSAIGKGCWKSSSATVTGTAPAEPTVTVVPRAQSGQITVKLPPVTEVCANVFIANWTYPVIKAVITTDPDGNNVTTNATVLISGSIAVTVSSYADQTFAITGLPLTTLVTYNVTAQNDWGTSVPHVSSFTTLAAGVPSSPTQLSATAVEGEPVATVTWTSSTDTGGLINDDGSTQMSYVLDLVNTTGIYNTTLPYNNATLSNTYTVVNLTLSRTYHIRMRGCNTLGCSSYSNWFTFSTSVTGANGATEMAPAFFFILFATVFILFN